MSNLWNLIVFTLVLNLVACASYEAPDNNVDDVNEARTFR
jgi:hypothetical protein